MEFTDKINPRSIQYNVQGSTATGVTTILTGDTGYRWMLIGLYATVDIAENSAQLQVADTSGNLFLLTLPSGTPMAAVTTPIVGSDGVDLVITLTEGNTAVPTARYRTSSQAVKIPST